MMLFQLRNIFVIWKKIEIWKTLFLLQVVSSLQNWARKEKKKSSEDCCSNMTYFLSYLWWRHSCSKKFHMRINLKFQWVEPVLFTGPSFSFTERRAKRILSYLLFGSWSLNQTILPSIKYGMKKVDDLWTGMM